MLGLSHDQIESAALQLLERVGLKDKRDAKDLAIRTLRKRAFPASKTYEVVWRLEDNRVLSFATSKAVTAIATNIA